MPVASDRYNGRAFEDTPRLARALLLEALSELKRVTEDLADKQPKACKTKSLGLSLCHSGTKKSDPRRGHDHCRGVVKHGDRMFSRYCQALPRSSLSCAMKAGWGALQRFPVTSLAKSIKP